jgi:hypothetical protein
VLALHAGAVGSWDWDAVSSWQPAELMEGGFDAEERGAIRAHAADRAIALGPRILRGETAAIAGTALWMGTVGDW